MANAIAYKYKIKPLNLYEKNNLTLGVTSKFKCWQLQDFANFYKPWQQQMYQPCLRIGNL